MLACVPGRRTPRASPDALSGTQRHDQHFGAIVSIYVDDFGHRPIAGREEQHTRPIWLAQPSRAEGLGEAERDRMRGESIEHNITENLVQDGSVQALSVGAAKGDIGINDATPPEIVVGAEAEPFLDAPLTSPNRVSLTRGAEAGRAFFVSIRLANNSPRSDVAIVIEIEQEDTGTIQHMNPVSDWSYHEFVVGLSALVGSGDGQSGQPVTVFLAGGKDAKVAPAYGPSHLTHLGRSRTRIPASRSQLFVALGSARILLFRLVRLFALPLVLTAYGLAATLRVLATPLRLRRHA
jgi:hypothetical protein